MLRHRSICRLSLFLTLLVSVVPITWLALPCPTLDQDVEAYPTHLLREGKVLTRVYETAAFYPTYLSNAHGYVTSASSPDDDALSTLTDRYFALHISLAHHRTTNTTTLHINNATTPLSQSQQPARATPLTATAPISDGDGIVLPSFPIADRALLQWAVDPHARNASLPLIVLGIFNYTSRVQTLDIRPAKAVQSEDSHPASEQVEAPLLRLRWRADDTPGLGSGGGSDFDWASVEAAVPAPPFSGSPSATYNIRLGMLTSMAPSILYVTETYGDLLTSIIEYIAWSLYLLMGYGYFLALIWSMIWWLVLRKPPLEKMLEWGNGRVWRASRGVERCVGRLEDMRARKGNQWDDLRVWWIVIAVWGEGTGAEGVVRLGGGAEEGRGKCDGGG